MASGDITLTTPVTKSIPGLTRQRLTIDTTSVKAEFLDSLGQSWVAIATNGQCAGFNVATGAVTNPVVAAGFTNAIGALLGAGASGANARITALINQLVTDGIIVVAGTVA